jgi:predicted Rossmann fold flavoprotein
MNEVIIIGGGASGLTAAIIVARNNKRVTILERNNTCGKKLLLTGNGKCNYLNENLDNKHFYSESANLLSKILTDKNKTLVNNFWDSLNIISKNKNGYLYPNSNESKTILDALLLECHKLNVNIKTNVMVNSIQKEKEVFILETNDGIYKALKVILASGGKAYPNTGSDGNGYKLIKKFNINVTKLTPGLTPLITKEKYDWAGIREDVSLTLEINHKIIKKEQGEIQLTNYGISGICVMNLSSLIKDITKSEAYIYINFLPMFKNNIELKNYFYDKSDNIKDLLYKCLNKKLVNVILNLSQINGNLKFNLLSSDKQELLLNTILNFKVEIIDSKPFKESQITVGGISLKEININNLECLKVKNLYITGELLDINGDCGGYNLTVAWLTGILAGMGATNDQN